MHTEWLNRKVWIQRKPVQEMERGEGEEQREERGEREGRGRGEGVEREEEGEGGRARECRLVFQTYDRNSRGGNLTQF